MRLWRRDEVLSHKASVIEAVDRLSELVREPKGNAFQQLRAFRKHTAVLLRHLDSVSDVLSSVKEMQREAQGDTPANNNKRWSDDEDMALVDLAASDGNSITSIALILGRSPGAVQNRLTYLVGIEHRIQRISGRFQGLIDGVMSEANIDGEIRKGSVV